MPKPIRCFTAHGPLVGVSPSLGFAQQRMVPLRKRTVNMWTILLITIHKGLLRVDSKVYGYHLPPLIITVSDFEFLNWLIYTVFFLRGKNVEIFNSSSPFLSNLCDYSALITSLLVCDAQLSNFRYGQFLDG